MPDTTNTPIRTIGVSEFRDQFSRLIARVAEHGDEIIVSKRGKPLARLIPYRIRPKSLLGIDKGSMRILGDIVDPLDIESDA